MPGCAWQEGYYWMTLPIEEMPLQTAEHITLSAEERRLAAAEVRGGDIRSHAINTVVADVADRYAYSKYLVDPCRLGWSKSLRVLALVRRFITRFKEGGRCCGAAEADPPPQLSSLRMSYGWLLIISFALEHVSLKNLANFLK
jgi:hypothetical protein